MGGGGGPVDDIMSGMQISSHLEFAGAPADVYAMLTDQKFLDEVCVASESLSYNASVEDSVTKTSRTLPAPESAARFTGPTVTVNEEVAWGNSSADGSRVGAITMTVLGQPVGFKATVRLEPGGRGSVVDIAGELKVAIPLLGRKLEEATAPAVIAAGWLASDRTSAHEADLAHMGIIDFGCRGEGLLDRARTGPADQVPHRAGLVIRP